MTEAENDVGGSASYCESETKQDMWFDGSLTEAEIMRNTILPWNLKKQNLRFGRSVAEAFRNGSFRWIRNGIKYKVCQRRDGSEK